MKYSKEKMDEGAQELQEYIEKGFNQFDSPPNGFPFKDDLVETFGSIYMLTRDIVEKMLYADNPIITEIDVMKMQKEWDKAMEIFALVDLVNDPEQEELWRGQVYKSYGQILLIIRVIQRSYVTQDE